MKTRTSVSVRLLLAFSVMGLWTCNQQSHAATLSWSGSSPTSGNWSDSQNWGFVGVPASGDTLIFPAAQPRLLNTNDIPGLTINQIRFVGAGGGYGIRGSPFTLTNGVAATNSAGVNTLFNAITLDGVQLINVGSGAGLTLAGTLSGGGGLIKSGAGTVTVSGADNAYTGDTTLNEGVLQLGSANAVRFGTLTIGDGWGGPASDIVRFTGAFPIFGGPGGSVVIIKSSGLLDQNGFSDDVGPIEMDGGRIETGAGTLTLFPPFTTYQTDATNGSPVFNGALNLSSASTFFISNRLDLNAVVSGSGSLTKIGPSDLFLAGNNTYSGLTVVQQGRLRMLHGNALGSSSSGTVVSNLASLIMDAAFGVTNEALVLNGFGIGSGWGALDCEASGTNFWTGPITLNADSTIVPYPASSVLRISGVISGPGGLIKGTQTGSGTGILYLDGPSANTYTGETSVRAGTLLLNKGVFDGAIPGALVVGNGNGVDVVRLLNVNQIPNSRVVTLNAGAIFDANGQFEGVGGFDLTGATVQTGAGFLDIYPPRTITTRASASVSTISGDLRLTGGVGTFEIEDGAASPDLQVSAVVQDGGITKIGPGNLQLSAVNTYQGLTTINDGFILINQPTGLGTAAAGTILNGGHLSIVGASVVAESLTNNSVNSLLQTSGTSGWGSNMVLSAELQVQVLSGTFDVSGVVSGTGDLTKTQPGTLRFSGTQANTYTGVTLVEAGTLELNKSSGVTAIPGNLVVGDGTGGVNADAVRFLSFNQIVNTSDVQLNSSGLFDLSTFFDTIDELSGNGNVTFGLSGYLTVGGDNGSSTFEGIASGTGFVGGYTLQKAGTGTFVLTGNNTYQNMTFVTGGTLLVNGSQPQSPLWVAVNSATAGGSGTVGVIQLEGNLAPGNSPGTLTSSNLFFTSAGDYFVELTGPTPGTQYDQLIVRGTNTLGNAVLHVNADFTTPVAVGQQFTIIDNDGSEAITGTFNGLPQGASITSGFYAFTISYSGGSGLNNVVLTLTNVPGAALGALSAVTTGNGNGVIDPNECNYLSVVLSNNTATPMTGISATLASITAGVVVPELPVLYPDAAGNSASTNVIPFQISTYSNFVCGSAINLQLAVTTTSHGAFILPVVIPSGTPAAVPVRFDNNTVTNVPDIGAIESTNTVAAWSGPLSKIAVSLWLVAPFSSDITLTLIAPNGDSVDLSSGNGAGANFGTGSGDASRTTFDDVAAVSITSGASPFVGTFRPEGSLDSLLAANPNGNWRLRINDGFGSGSPDTLRAWSLFLYGSDCVVGDGVCELCPNVTITSATGPSSPIQNGYVNPNGVSSVCGVAKVCPGTTPSAVPSANFKFQNGPADACITVTLSNANPGIGMLAAAYTDGFDPSNPDKCTNYLADIGNIVFAGERSFSFNVTSNATFIINLVAGGSIPYKLAVTGGDCRPVLNITPAGATGAVLDWTTAAAGYQLEQTNTVSSGAAVWPPVVGEPVIVNGRYTVTNQITGTNQFFRLRKPVTPEL